MLNDERGSNGFGYSLSLKILDILCEVLNDVLRNRTQRQQTASTLEIDPEREIIERALRTKAYCFCRVPIRWKRYDCLATRSCVTRILVR